jgi:hypothetical protein
MRPVTFPQKSQVMYDRLSEEEPLCPNRLRAGRLFYEA